MYADDAQIYFIDKVFTRVEPQEESDGCTHATLMLTDSRSVLWEISETTR